MISGGSIGESTGYREINPKLRLLQTLYKKNCKESNSMSTISVKEAVSFATPTAVVKLTKCMASGTVA